MSRRFASMLIVLTLAGVTSAQPPIIELKITSEKARRTTNLLSPTIIKNAKKAAEYFDLETQMVLAKEVDFDKQFVLIFSWQGSSGDRMRYKVQKDGPERITFSFRTGGQTDIRWNWQIFALRNGLEWDFKDE